MADLELSTTDRVMVARLNRPEKKNALSEEMLDLLRDALQSANDDPEVGCFVITGAGDAFCSGGDLGRRSQESAAGDPTPLERKTRLQKVTHKVALAVEQFEKPLIAAVNGAAVGAGMDLALMCDLRFAGRSARFSEGYIRVGLLPGNGGCYFLPRLVGTARALELLWTGDFVGADEALSDRPRQSRLRRRRLDGSRRSRSLSGSRAARPPAARHQEAHVPVAAHRPANKP